MTPATIALIIQLVQQLIIEIPSISAELQSIFNNPNPTPADWEALKAKVMAQSYATLVPDSKLAA